LIYKYLKQIKNGGEMPIFYRTFEKEGKKLRIVESDFPMKDVVLFDVKDEKLEKINRWVEEEKLRGRECILDPEDKVIVCVTKYQVLKPKE
jgi:hypothetical protein